VNSNTEGGTLLQMDTILCPKCGNAAPKDEKICIYCQAPLLRKSFSYPQNKLKIRLILTFGLIFLAMAIDKFPDLVRSFRGEDKTVSPVVQPLAKKPPIEEPKPAAGTSALAAYKKLRKAIDSDDEETAKGYVNNARWNQLELEEDHPSGVEELNTRCNVENKFESEEMDDRAVLTAKSQPIKDQDGKPSFTVLVVNMAKEDDQWKVFSSSCIYGVSDYINESRAWLFEQPAVVGDDLNSKLVANGLPDGEASCFLAVDQGQPKAVKRCFETGWSVDAEDSDGRKAIDLALAKMEYESPDNNEVIELFVKEGANVDRPNGQGMTPLMLAAIHCNADAAKAFMDAGADINYKTKDGITLSKLAENCPPVTKLLRASKTQ
jgi:hypothetical protein